MHGGWLRLKQNLVCSLNETFALLNQKSHADAVKANGGKQPQNSDIDYAERVKNTFSHMMINVVVIRSFLEKYGYGKYWSSWDVKDLYDTYTILKCKNYE